MHYTKLQYRTKSQCSYIVKRPCFSKYFCNTVLHWPNGKRHSKPYVSPNSDNITLQTCFNVGNENRKAWRKVIDYSFYNWSFLLWSFHIRWTAKGNTCYILVAIIFFALLKSIWCHLYVYLRAFCLNIIPYLKTLTYFTLS